MINLKGSIGRDSQGTAQWSKHHWAGKKPGPNPTDRAKSGPKRSLLVDGAGIPLGLVIDGANRVDFKRVEETIVSIATPRSVEPARNEATEENLCLDGGYDYDEVRRLGEVFGYTLHSVPRDKEARELKREAGKRA